MDDDADNRGPEHAPVKHISVLKYMLDESVRILILFCAFDGLVETRIENLSGGVNALQAVAREGVKKLFANQHHAPTIFFVSWIVMRLKGAVESIEHRNQIHHQPLDAAAAL